MQLQPADHGFRNFVGGGLLHRGIIDFVYGEEFYAATAYLSQDPKVLGTIKGTDVMKLGLVLLILIGGLLSTLGYDAFAAWFRVR